MRMRQNTYIHDFSCYTTAEEEDWRRREDLLQRTRDGFVGRECLKIQLSFRTRCLYMYVTALPLGPAAIWTRLQMPSFLLLYFYFSLQLFTFMSYLFFLFYSFFFLFWTLLTEPVVFRKNNVLLFLFKIRINLIKSLP